MIVTVEVRVNGKLHVVTERVAESSQAPIMQAANNYRDRLRASGVKIVLFEVIRGY